MLIFLINKVKFKIKRNLFQSIFNLFINIIFILILNLKNLFIN